MATYALSTIGSSQRDAGRSLVKTAEVNFICPNCSSFYEIVKTEAVPESLMRISSAQAN
jgi:hypothetical protein